MKEKIPGLPVSHYVIKLAIVQCLIILTSHFFLFAQEDRFEWPDGWQASFAFTNKPPQFPNRCFDIRDFGAVGDGHTVNTIAIEQAIRTCAQNGGGRVIVPAGIWLSGPLTLANNVDLHLQEQALLIFSRNLDDYPLIETSFEGITQFRCLSPINAVGMENLAITGKGIIDGSGDSWRPVKRFKMTPKQWDDLVASGGVVNRYGTIWWPTLKAMQGEEYFAWVEKNALQPHEKDVLPIKDYLRPVMVRLVQCKNILLDGPTFQNSPAWNIHPFLCENVTIRNIQVRNPWFAQNGDGLDIEACKNVLVENCIFDVGDDAICLKSGRNEEGRRRGKPTEKIIIRHCTVFHGHGGFTIGSEMSGGVQDVVVSDCTFSGTDVGLRFKSTRGRGGTVERIYIRNIRMLDIPNQAILFDLFYEGDGIDSTAATIPPVDERTPIFRQIYLENIFCRQVGQAVVMNGLPEMPLEEIEMDSLVMSCSQGIFCRNGKNIRFLRSMVLSEKMPVFHIIDSHNVEIAPTSLTAKTKGWLKVEGAQSRQIQISTQSAIDLKELVTLGKGASKDAVIVRFGE